MDPSSELLDIYPDLRPLLDKLVLERDSQLETFARVLRAAGGRYTQEDCLFHAIVDRSVSLTDAFMGLIRVWNFMAATALVRLQLDSMLRAYYVARFPTERQRILSQWIQGTAFDKILQTKEGKEKLTDRNLRKVIEPIFPTIETVYSDLCDYVHLSTKHISSTGVYTDSTSRLVHVTIGSRKEHIPENEYQKVIEMFLDFCQFLSQALKEWEEYKSGTLRKQTQPAEDDVI